MTTDPIVDEVRKAGDAYFKKFNYDLKAAFEDMRHRTEQSGRKVVSLPPRPAKPRPSRTIKHRPTEAA